MAMSKYMLIFILFIFHREWLKPDQVPMQNFQLNRNSDRTSNDEVHFRLGQGCHSGIELNVDQETIVHFDPAAVMLNLLASEFLGKIPSLLMWLVFGMPQVHPPKN